MLLDILQRGPASRQAFTADGWSKLSLYICPKHPQWCLGAGHEEPGNGNNNGFRILQMSTWSPAQQLCISYTLMVLQLSVSSVLILVNKWILSVLRFNFPIILSSSGMLFSALATHMLIDILQVIHIPEETQKAASMYFRVTRMWPIALVNAITLATGNYAYLYLSVSIIQVLKSLTPVITLALLVTLRMTTPTLALVASVFVITLGCGLAAWGEVNTAGESTVFGLAILMCSEIVECIRVVLVQYLLEGRSDVHLNAVTTLYYTAGPTFVCCQLCAIPLEYQRVLQHPLGELAAQPFIIVAASSLGFLVNILAFLVIQTAKGGSLTFKSAQMLKNAVLAIISSYIFGNVIATSVRIGYAISIIGFAWYTLVSAELKTALQKPALSSK